MTLDSLLTPIESELVGLAQVAEVTMEVDEVDILQGLGVMLYYGDTKASKEEVKATPEDKKELSGVRDLLHHCIMGLAAIQHNGNMIIKVHETHDAFTVGIIFALYNLF